jgi:hypothetical protein
MISRFQAGDPLSMRRPQAENAGRIREEDGRTVRFSGKPQENTEENEAGEENQAQPGATLTGGIGTTLRLAVTRLR